MKGAGKMEMRWVKNMTTVVLMIVAGLGATSVGDIAFDPGPPSDGYLYTGNSTWGLEFVPTVSITVVDLGIWDYEGDGLGFDHSIGIWRKSDQTLIVSGVVSAGTDNPLVDEFRYVDVIDTPLTVGEHYLLGACYPLVPAGEITYDPLVLVEQLQVDPAITQVGWNELFGSPGFAPPIELVPGGDPDGPFFFGPNFQFTTGETVPVPGALFLGSIGLIVAGWKLRRREE